MRPSRTGGDVAAAERACTWEDSVRWLRAQPNMDHVIRESYLGEDVLAEARRFAASAEFREVCRLLGLHRYSRPLRILDLGCGNGIASFALAALGHQVVALDPDLSDTVGLRAVGRLADVPDRGLLLRVAAGAEALPFTDASFDAVYARQALHHLSNLERGMRECVRVLNPGGVMVAAREHVVDDEAQLQAFLDDHPLHRLYGGENAFGLEVYIGAARDAGMDIRAALGPYDSVVNYFPKPEATVRDTALRYLARRLGPVGARLALELPGVLPRYLRRMSCFDRTPGRLYSFVFVKAGSGR